MRPITLKQIVAIFVAESAYFGFTMGAFFWWRGLGLFDAAKGSSLVSTFIAVLVLLILIGGWFVWYWVHDLMDD